MQIHSIPPPGSEKESERFLRGQGLKSMTSPMKKLKIRSFFCADEAMAAFRSTLLNGFADAYDALIPHSDLRDTYNICQIR